MDCDLFQDKQVSNELEAYLLGFFYADGCVHNNTFSIALAEKDKDFLQWILDILNNVLNTAYVLRYNEKTKSYKFTISNRNFVEKLMSLGIVPHKTYENSDFVFKNIPDNFKWHFIRGYFDGDGCICYSQRNYIDKRNQKEYTQKYMIVSIVGTNDFLLSLSNILKNYGINFKMTKTSNTGKAKEIRLTKKNEIKKFYDYIYNNCSVKLERKYSKFIESFNQFNDLKMAS